MKKQKVYLAADHAGFECKEFVKRELIADGYEVRDCGAGVYDATDDYPRFVAKAARAVSDDLGGARAIVFGASGQGEAIAANKFPRVRACVFYGGDEEILTLSRAHNDANVLAIGARFISPEEAAAAAKKWLSGKFSQEVRHKRRIAEIAREENTLQKEYALRAMRRRQIIPAILEELMVAAEKRMELFQDAPWVQIDICDGTFTDSHTFAPEEFDTKKYPPLLEAHLMVANPAKYIDRCARAGFQRVFFHSEVEDDTREVIKKIQSANIEAGIAVSPETKIFRVKPYFSLVDAVLVMGVVPGRSGQKMLGETISRLRQVRNHTPHTVRVGVDGGVKKENVRELFAAGADFLCVGSAITSQKSLREFEELV